VNIDRGLRLYMKIRIYQLGSCSDCINELLRIGETLLEMILEEGMETISPMMTQINTEIESCDAALVEGAMVSNEDEEKLKAIRGKSKILVALGTCALLGGIPA